MKALLIVNIALSVYVIVIFVFYASTEIKKIQKYFKVLLLAEILNMRTILIEMNRLKIDYGYSTIERYEHLKDYYRKQYGVNLNECEE